MLIKLMNGETISPTRKVMRVCNPCLNLIILKVGTDNFPDSCTDSRGRLISLMRGRPDRTGTVAAFDTCGCILRPRYKKNGELR